jgi:hypothetical protein
MRLLVQSKSTGLFLIPNPEGEPEWTRDLRRVGCGVVLSIEHAAQLVEDWTDVDDLPQVIDLDRLGTVNDYT